jgi:hypothetical protein
LLEQSDAGARVLAFLALHNPELSFLSPSDRTGAGGGGGGGGGGGTSAAAYSADEAQVARILEQRKSALLQVCKIICSRLSSTLPLSGTDSSAMSTSPTLSSSTMSSAAQQALLNSPTIHSSPSSRASAAHQYAAASISASPSSALATAAAVATDGAYFFTVALSSIVSDTLGETAACWVSSVIELLQNNQQLVVMVNARVFARLPLLYRSHILAQLLAPPITIPSSSHRGAGASGANVTALNMPEARDTRHWGLLVLKETPIAIQEQHLDDITTLMVDNSASETVRIGAIQLYCQVVSRAPMLASLSILRTLMLDQHPRIAIAAVETWDTVSREYGCMYITQDYQHH